MPIKNDWTKNKKYQNSKKTDFAKIEKYITDDEKEILKAKRLYANNYRNNQIIEDYKNELIKIHKYEFIKKHLLKIILIIVITAFTIYITTYK